MRERVWQTLKDVKAIEHHVRQQNALNRQMRQEIVNMEESSDKEKEIIEMLVDTGMRGISNRINLLKAAVDANVTGVRAALQDLDQSLVGNVVLHDSGLDMQFVYIQAPR
jgi:hypothetical protein